MLKVIHGLTPMYMTDNIVMAEEMHDRDTRLSDSNDVNIPLAAALAPLVGLGSVQVIHIPTHNSDVNKRSFIYSGSVIWNNIPDETRMATEVSDFKRGTSV